MEIIKNKRFTYIDGLRGFAALSVMFFHFYVLLSKKGQVQVFPKLIHAYFMHGNLGVQIFFVLSGFVIAHSIWKEGITWSYVGNFALRRSLRLDPPYWIIIVLTYIALYFTKSGAVESPIKSISIGDALLNFFYLDKLAGVQFIVSVGWTLQIEIQFYLCFILLLFLIEKVKNKINPDANIVLWIVFVPLFLLGCAIQYKFISITQEGLFLPYWSMFFIGTVSCWVIDKRIHFVWIVIFVGLMLLANRITGENNGSLLAILVAITILIAAYFDKLCTWLSNPIIQYFGVRSYSIYLVHSLIGNKVIRYIMRKYPNAATENIWQAALIFLIACIFSLIAAEIFYQLVEKTSIKFAKRFSLNKNQEHLV